MTLNEQLHKSKLHADGWDQSCPKCVREGGVTAIIKHLERCATQNEADANTDSDAGPVAAEQRRMIGVLKLYRKVTA